MKKEPKDITDSLGHYMEGDYMVEEIKENHIIYTSPETLTGFRLELTDNHTIMITGAHGSNRSFTFDTQEDWEDFCEAVWKTEHYMAVRKKDFIEFFQALMFVHSYHKNTIETGKKKLIEAQREVNGQEKVYDGIQKILSAYEEVYNESKVQ